MTHERIRELEVLEFLDSRGFSRRLHYLHKAAAPMMSVLEKLWKDGEVCAVHDGNEIGSSWGELNGVLPDAYWWALSNMGGDSLRSCRANLMAEVVRLQSELEDFRKRLRLAQTFAHMTKLFVTDPDLKPLSPLLRGGCVCGGEAPACECGWFQWLDQAAVLQCIPGAKVPSWDCDLCKGEGEYMDPKVSDLDGIPDEVVCDCWIEALDPKLVVPEKYRKPG